MSKAAEAYVAAGFALTPIPRGSKAPKARGWNEPAAAVTTKEQAARLNGCNLGLLHAYSGTCAVDVDDLTRAGPWLKARGIDLDQLLKARGAVQIVSGREGRAKLLYRLPEGCEPLPTLKLAEGALELRCASKDGLSVQDVLPPSIHPDTGRAYEWRGNWKRLPVLPEQLWTLWAGGPKGAEAHPVAVGGAPLPIVTGLRNDYLTSKAGELRHIGMSEAAILGALRGINAAECKPPLADKEVQTIARSVARYEPATAAAAPPAELVFSDFVEFSRLDIPPRKTILEPWIQEQSLVMVHGWRGVGKTNFALTAALCVATGVAFGPWKVQEPRPVAYLDFEMDAPTMQLRLRGIADSLGRKPEPGFFKLYTPDLQPGRTLNLAYAEDQATLEPFLEGAAVVFIDNLSAGIRGAAAENEAESAEPMIDFGLAQRRAGRSGIFLHHSNKDGRQRGTSRREDALDTVLKLEHPDDYQPEQGARFTVTFEKTRGFYGETARPVELAMQQERGKLVWVSSAVARETAVEVAALLAEGLTQAQIARRIKKSEAAVSRAAQKAKLDGLWKPAAPKRRAKV